MKMRIKSFLIMVLMLALTGCATVNSAANSEDAEKANMKKLIENEWTEWGSFNMEGRNFTPPRVVDTEQYKYLEVKATYYSKDKPVLFTLGAYSMHYDVLGQFQTNPAVLSGEATVKLPVEKGQEIQVFTQIWDEEGVYDDDYPVEIQLSYRLTN